MFHMKQMFNEIFYTMGLEYVEDETMWQHFKKLCKRTILALFWGPVFLAMKLLKKLGLLNIHNL